MVMVTTPTGGR
ncbi:hypothetical protein AVEN_96999-1, partial [Araneus ventricosus]